jgi:hypothetical protein
MASLHTQIAVFLDNVPGMLADLCGILLEGGINILAVSVSDTVDHSVVRMVVDKPANAIHRLGDVGTLVVERDVVLVEVDNRPGVLKEVAAKLAAAGINIEYLYGTALESGGRGTLVLRTSDSETAVQLLS